MSFRHAVVLGFALGLATPAASKAYYVESRGGDGDGGAAVPLTFDASAPVAYRIAAGTPAEVASAIEAAFQTWEDVPCATIAFARGEDDDMPRANHWTGVGDHRYILVYPTDDPSIFTSPAVARFQFAFDEVPRLFAGVIFLNTKDHAWSTTGEADKLDVQSIVTAMVGRTLGITSALAGNATYPSYAPGDVSKRTLGEDDLAGIQYLYGAEGECDPPPPEAICEAFDDACPPAPGSSGGDGGVGGGDDGDGGGVPVVDAGVTPPEPMGTLRDGGSVFMGDAATGDDDDDGDDASDSDDDGCSAGHGRANGAALVWSSLAGLFMAGRRRTRRRKEPRTHRG